MVIHFHNSNWYSDFNIWLWLQSFSLSYVFSSIFSTKNITWNRLCSLITIVGTIQWSLGCIGLLHSCCARHWIAKIPHPPFFLASWTRSTCMHPAICMLERHSPLQALAAIGCERFWALEHKWPLQWFLFLSRRGRQTHQQLNLVHGLHRWGRRQQTWHRGIRIAQVEGWRYKKRLTLGLEVLWYLPQEHTLPFPFPEQFSFIILHSLSL